MYVTKKTGTFSLNEITPDPTPHQRWQWIFFHPDHNPEHEHVALFLLTEEAFLRPSYDCYHFGVDKARQFLGITSQGPLRGIRLCKETDRVFINVSIGQIPYDEKESDGYGSCLLMKCYEYSHVEFEKMYNEFEIGFIEMGWSRPSHSGSDVPPTF